MDARSSAWSKRRKRQSHGMRSDKQRGWSSGLLRTGSDDSSTELWEFRAVLPVQHTNMSYGLLRG